VSIIFLHSVSLTHLSSLLPVSFKDEIDEISQSNSHGDPSAALLKVLDPEHNFNIAIDLSQVLFICTGNSLETTCAPLLDRCEIMRLRCFNVGYTYDEKMHIACRFLPKQLKSNGLDASHMTPRCSILRPAIHGRRA